MSNLDALGPHAGPCAFCDHPDARHRQADAIRDLANAGDTVETIARELNLTPGAVRTILEEHP